MAQPISGVPWTSEESDDLSTSLGEFNDGQNDIELFDNSEQLDLVRVKERGFSILDGPQTIDRTGATRTDVAIQAAYDAATAIVRTTRKAAGNETITRPVTQTLHIPGGSYQMQQPLVLSPDGPSITMSPDAELKAAANMSALIQGPTSGTIERSRFKGGILNCNGFASAGLALPQFIAVHVGEMEVLHPTADGLVFGDDGSGAITSYELTLREIDIRRPRDVTPAAGKAAVWMRKATDSSIIDVVARGWDVGTRTESVSGSNTFCRVHVWNPSGTTGPSICFDDAAGGSMYDHCYADTPSLYGWRIRNDLCTITAPRAFLNSQGSVNQATAFYLDSAPQLTISGGFVRAAGSARWLRDIQSAIGGGFNNLTWLGVRSESTTVTNRAFGERTVLKGVYFYGDPNATAVQLEARNVDPLTLFVGGNKKYGLHYQGAQRLPVFTTATRPTTTTSGGAALGTADEGLEIWNKTTKKKEIWDGAAWVDALGNAL